MKKVYILRFYKGYMDDYDEEIIGVYTDTEIAETRAKEIKQNVDCSYWDYTIDTYILNA